MTLKKFEILWKYGDNIKYKETTQHTKITKNNESKGKPSKGK